MSFATLFQLLGPDVGVALLAAATVLSVALLAFWKLRDRERWIGTVGPLALAAGFVSAYARLFEFPAKWDDDAWKWSVVAAAVAGLLLAIERSLSRKIAWFVSLVVAVTIAWITTRLFKDERTWFMSVLAGAIVLYLAAFWPVMRDPRLWLIGPAVLLICGFWAVRAVMPYEMNTGRMYVVVAALAGLCIVAGFIKPLRASACAGAALLAVIFALVATLTMFYVVPYTYPDTSSLLWMIAAPLAVAVTWIPWLNKRPWWCLAAAIIVAAALLAPSVVIALKDAPPIET